MEESLDIKPIACVPVTAWNRPHTRYGLGSTESFLPEEGTDGHLLECDPKVFPQQSGLRVSPDIFLCDRSKNALVCSSQTQN